MIEANHLWLWQWLFSHYLNCILKRDFQKIVINGSWTNNKESYLLIGNHISWWDGFWALYLNNNLLKKKIYVMMLEEQLKSRKLLSRLGAFSIQPGTRSVLKSLDYAAQKLRGTGNLVVIYPQGKISPITANHPHFFSGIEKILNPSSGNEVLFYAVFVDYFSNRKPSLYFYLGEAAIENNKSEELEEKYYQFYEESRLIHATKAR